MRTKEVKKREKRMEEASLEERRDLVSTKNGWTQTLFKIFMYNILI